MRTGPLSYATRVLGVRVADGSSIRYASSGQVRKGVDVYQSRLLQVRKGVDLYRSRLLSSVMTAGSKCRSPLPWPGTSIHALQYHEKQAFRTQVPHCA
eukprot:3564296-Rhodomonas_salina.1